jgi:hypothetical protein
MKILWSPPPGTFWASGSRCAVRRQNRSSRTVPGVKGSLRRGIRRRAPDTSAPFRTMMARDGRLRREPDAEQFLCLTEDKNQIVVDKTS